MFSKQSGQRYGVVVAALTAALAGVALPAPAAAAETTVFFEQTTEAFWTVPHTCADGSVVQATLLVRSTLDYESPETEDADPTARIQYLAVCPEGTFSWIASAADATITSSPNLKSVTVTGSGIAQDNLGGLHEVTFDVTWTGVGPLETSVRTTSNPGSSVNTSTTKQREATATGEVTFDGAVLVDGPADHPTRPAPFIRTDEERTTRP